MKLRPYQSEAIEGVYRQLSEYVSTLLVMATGTGKTVTFAHVANAYLKYGRVMMLAHREELIHQGYQKLHAITGKEPDVEMGDYHCARYGQFKAPIIVSTIQTQISGMGGEGRMTKFDPNEFSLLIIDEAHHSCAASYRRVIDYYRNNPELKILGVTATPDRADEEALGQIFESVAFEYGIREGIGDGWLVPIQQRAVYVDGLDYSGIKTTAGDLNGGELAAVLEYEENLHRIAHPTIELVGDRKSLVFAASVAHAERLTEIFNRHRPNCSRFVTGTTDKDQRREMFKDYAAKRFQILVNVGVATEGFDDPGIEVVVMGRPTKSRSLYAQMTGRGTRPLPGLVDGLEDPGARRGAIVGSRKPFLEVIDFVGNAGRHKLVTTADILGGNYSDEIVELAKMSAQEKSSEGKAVDMMSELELAEQKIHRERQKSLEQAQRQKVMLRAKYSTAKINPFDVLDVEPYREKAWHKGRMPTAKQLEFLDKRGVDCSGLSFTSASQLIDQIVTRMKTGMATYRQVNRLKMYGYDTSNMTFEQASKAMSELAANGWRRPA